MPIDFPQEFLLVDRVPTFFCYLDETRLVEGGLFLFSGHGWREKRESSGDAVRVEEPFYPRSETVWLNGRGN